MTLLDRGSKNWDTLLIQNLKDVLPLYNLEELFTVVNFTPNDREQFSKKVQTSSKCKPEHDCHSTGWLSKLIQSYHKEDCKNLTFTSDLEIKSLSDALVPFRYSLKNRLDGAVLRTFHCDGREWKLPLFILEVHSDNYRNTVSQTAADLIDQLRLLRCFCRNIVQCVGFTFPKYPDLKASAPNKSCVTKVVVSFESFRFVVRLFPLDISDVKEEIKTALSEALKFSAEHPQFCFLRLSDSDLQYVCDHLNVHKLHQHSSKHSIVLENGEVFWKHVPRMKQSHTLRVLKTKVKDQRHILLHSSVELDPEFFSFPVQLPPLTKAEVSMCLIDFMVRTASALEILHGFGYAHLDVRIPNICFSKEKNAKGEYEVKLIDLDRCVTLPPCDLCGYDGEMYRCPSHWNMDKVDWKQLGLLAGRIITKNEMSDEAVVHSSFVSSDQCLRELINEGTL